MSKCCLYILILVSVRAVAQNNSCIPLLTVVANQNNICTGTAITFHATVENKGTNEVYKWKKNNRDAGVNDNSYYTSVDFYDGDVVTCEYSCKTACGVDTMIVSKPFTVHVLDDITPVITISNSDSLICEGELTMFTSKASYGNATPSYQWLVNGRQVGSNSPDYTTTTLTNGSRVECVLTISTPACPIIRTASSQMNIYVYPMIHPAITITPSRSQVCRGEAVTFTATANGGAAPNFAWEVNGKPTGDVSPAFVTSTLNDGDTVSCTITIDQDSRCHTSTSAPSNKVIISVHNFITPTFSIDAPVLDACAGTALRFVSTAQNAGSFLLYQWMVNGRSAGAGLPDFASTTLANGDKVSCTLSTNVPGCNFTLNLPSNEKTVTIRSIPVITFSPPEIKVLSGEAAQLTATVSGTVQSFVWKPDGALIGPQSLAPVTVPLTHDTTFTLAVVDRNGCMATKDLPVKVLYKLYMPSAFTPNKDGKNDLFRIPPGASIDLHEVSVFDRRGNIVFSTTDSTKGWNGTYGGAMADGGTYVYLITGVVKDKEVLIKGTVTLLR